VWHPFLWIECKHQRKWRIETWMQESHHKAHREMKLPLLVVNHPRDRKPLAIMPLEALGWILEAMDGHKQNTGRNETYPIRLGEGGEISPGPADDPGDDSEPPF